MSGLLNFLVEGIDPRLQGEAQLADLINGLEAKERTGGEVCSLSSGDLLLVLAGESVVIKNRSFPEHFKRKLKPARLKFEDHISFEDYPNASGYLSVSEQSRSLLKLVEFTTVDHLKLVVVIHLIEKGKGTEDLPQSFCLRVGVCEDVLLQGTVESREDQMYSAQAI